MNIMLMHRFFRENNTFDSYILLNSRRNCESTGLVDPALPLYSLKHHGPIQQQKSAEQLYTDSSCEGAATTFLRALSYYFWITRMPFSFSVLRSSHGFRKGSHVSLLDDGSFWFLQHNGDWQQSVQCWWFHRLDWRPCWLPYVGF